MTTGTQKTHFFFLYFLPGTCFPCLYLTKITEECVLPHQLPLGRFHMGCGFLVPWWHLRWLLIG